VRSSTTSRCCAASTIRQSKGYEPQNDIKGWKPIDGAPIADTPAGNAAAAAAAPATTSAAAPAWAQKKSA
jgi:hypothetical protein